MVVAAVAAAGVASAAVGAISSSDAASAQTSAANNATNEQQAQFNSTQQNLAPYITSGTTATNALNNLTGAGTSNPLTSPLLAGAPLPPTMTEAQLKQTPGYEFNLSQGLESTQNSAAARGLGNSGAALKGAANYATGLADSTYQNQFNNYQTMFNDTLANQTNSFNRLMGLSSQGENAAAGLGNVGAQTASNIGSNIIGAGNAQGAADIAGGNAFSSAANSGASNYLLANYLNSGGV